MLKYIYINIFLALFILGACAPKQQRAPSTPTSNPSPAVRSPQEILCDPGEPFLKKAAIIREFSRQGKWDLLDQIVENKVSNCPLDSKIRQETMKVVSQSRYQSPTEKANYIRSYFGYSDAELSEYAGSLYEDTAAEYESMGSDFIIRTFPESDKAKMFLLERLKPKFQQSFKNSSLNLRAVYLEDYSHIFDRPVLNCPRCKQLTGWENEVFWTLNDHLEKWTPLAKISSNTNDLEVIWTNNDNLLPVYKRKDSFIVDGFISFNKILLHDFGPVKLDGLPYEETETENSSTDFILEEREFDLIVSSYIDSNLGDKRLTESSNFASYISPYLVAKDIANLKGHPVSLENNEEAYQSGKGIVLVNGVNLNQRLFKEGLAVCVDDGYWKVKCDGVYLEEQTFARKSGIGAWSSKLFGKVLTALRTKVLDLSMSLLENVFSESDDEYSFFSPERVDHDYEFRGDVLKINWQNYYDEDPFSEENLGFGDIIAIRKGKLSVKDLHKLVTVIYGTLILTTFCIKNEDYGTSLFEMLHISDIDLVISQRVLRFKYDKYGNKTEISPRILINAEFCLNKTKAINNNWENIFQQITDILDDGNLKKAISTATRYFSCAKFY